MDRVVTIEPLGHQAQQCAADRKLIALRDLVLDDGVHDRMHVRYVPASKPSCRW